MEQLARLKARIESLEELRNLMRAMRALAASRVQEAQAALDGIRQYVGVMEDAIGAGVTLLPGAAATAAPRWPGDDVLILICSEHGFVAGFNEQLIARAADSLQPHRQLAIVGQCGVDLAAERGLQPIWSDAMATQVGGVLALARRVADRLAGVGRAELLFGGYRRGGNYEVETHRVLPLDPSLLRRAAAHAPPLHHLPAQRLLARLADEYLLAEVTRAIMESLASENGARLHVMEAADRNIDNRLQRLGGQAHTLRQQTITAELLDLMTGAEAILGDR